MADGLVDKLKRLGYDRRFGLSLTYDDPSITSPLTVPLIPGMGIVRKPPDRPLSQDEVTHEGVHVGLGLPGAAASTLASHLLGISPTSQIAPDEALAYLMESGPESGESRKTLRGVAATEKRGNPAWFKRGYLSLIEALAGDNK